MPKVRGNPSAKWVRRAGAASQDYAEGVANPRTDWAQATVAAAPAQAAGAQAAIARGAYQQGVKRAGSAKWASKSAGKGAARFGPGVADAQSDYEAGVAPYTKAIENVKLPARGAKGDPANIQRVVAINKALRDTKLALQSK